VLPNWEPPTSDLSSIADFAVDEPVDAVIGRLILMHLPDPVAILRHLAGQIRPGGLIAFGETDITPAGSVPVVSLVQAVKDGISVCGRRRMPLEV
jgi:2-polyprenyl-3-methyl-5-hydroxy-6-metoxy-1,4-benzoquinol methylase